MATMIRRTCAVLLFSSSLLVAGCGGDYEVATGRGGGTGSAKEQAPVPTSDSPASLPAAPELAPMSSPGVSPAEQPAPGPLPALGPPPTTLALPPTRPAP